LLLTIVCCGAWTKCLLLKCRAFQSRRATTLHLNLFLFFVSWNNFNNWILILKLINRYDVFILKFSLFLQRVYEMWDLAQQLLAYCKEFCISTARDLCMWWLKFIFFPKVPFRGSWAHLSVKEPIYLIWKCTTRSCIFYENLQESCYLYC
jgi:hypothetical protein